MSNESKKTYLTQMAVARTCGVAPATLKSRIESGRVVADAILRVGGKAPGLLFSADNLNAIRQALGMNSGCETVQ
jgi:hypothetical protein